MAVLIEVKELPMPRGISRIRLIGWGQAVMLGANENDESLVIR